MTGPLYAKSASAGRPPVPLVDHLLASQDAARAIGRRVGHLTATSAAMPGAVACLPRVAGGPPSSGWFWPVVEVAAVCHDLGKVARGFQDMLAGRSRSWGQRHEVLSLGFLPAVVADPDLLLWVGSAVLTHHRPLTAPLGSRSRSIATTYTGLTLEELRDELGPVDDAAVTALRHWLNTVDLPTGADRRTGAVTSPTTRPPASAAGLVAAAHGELDRLLRHWATPVDPTTGLAAVLLHGALTMADHLASAGGILHEHQPIGATFPQRLAGRFGGEHRIHPHQHACGQTEGHLLLRSPTGSGKTEAGLLWAARQVVAISAATGGTPRVFLTLPYLASINAMATRLGALLGDPHLVGVAHSRAASYHLTRATATDDTATLDPGTLDTGTGRDTGDHPQHPDRRAAAQKAVSEAAATRLFRETVRVATPYQLLRAALAGPAHSSILVDCANSVIVLDELHAYDATRLGYILASAKLWEQLGCRIAVLSATLPATLVALVADTLHLPVAVQLGPPGPPRHRIQLREHQLTDPQSTAEIAADLRADRSVLVVANNVADAQTLFDRLAPIARDRNGHDAAILLHSRFTRHDRATIETRLSDRYASTATPRQPGLVVATQVVEVSLDLDLDVLHTAGAPLEALLQRFGRINRRGARPPADVVICRPGFGPRRNGPRDTHYADGVYEAQPVELALAILARHHGQAIDETAATGWLNEIYTSDWGQRWHGEVTRARQVFTRDFLTFHTPLAARDDLETRFDELFDGVEAILDRDRDAYAARLAGGPTTTPGAADRLLGEEYLIPLPHWATALAAYDKRLRVPVIDGDYDPERGLLAVRPVRGVAVYQPGEVL